MHTTTYYMALLVLPTAHVLCSDRCCRGNAKDDVSHVRALCGWLAVRVLTPVGALRVCVCGGVGGAGLYHRFGKLG